MGETDPSWAEVRAVLRDRGVADAAVVLPEDHGGAWEGALTVSSGDDARWALSTVDYGQSRVLLRRSTAAEIVTALY